MITKVQAAAPWVVRPARRAATATTQLATHATFLATMQAWHGDLPGAFPFAAEYLTPLAQELDVLSQDGYGSLYQALFGHYQSIDTDHPSM